MTTREPIEWNDSFLTGIDEIDRQHRILVSTLNEVDAKLSGSPSQRLFEQITRDLLAYAIYHFETEERLIKRYGYEDSERQEAEEHIKQHRNFSARVLALRAEAQATNTASLEALTSFLRDWLVHHIGTTDQRLAKFIRAKHTDAGPK